METLSDSAQRTLMPPVGLRPGGFTPNGQNPSSGQSSNNVEVNDTQFTLAQCTNLQEVCNKIAENKLPGYHMAISYVNGGKRKKGAKDVLTGDWTKSSWDSIEHCIKTNHGGGTWRFKLATHAIMGGTKNAIHDATMRLRNIPDWLAQEQLFTFDNETGATGMDSAEEIQARAAAEAAARVASSKADVEVKKSQLELEKLSNPTPAAPAGVDPTVALLLAEIKELKAKDAAREAAALAAPKGPTLMEMFTGLVALATPIATAFANRPTPPPPPAPDNSLEIERMKLAAAEKAAETARIQADIAARATVEAARIAAESARQTAEINRSSEDARRAREDAKAQIEMFKTMIEAGKKDDNKWQMMFIKQLEEKKDTGMEWLMSNFEKLQDMGIIPMPGETGRPEKPSIWDKLGDAAEKNLPQLLTVVQGALANAQSRATMTPQQQQRLEQVASQQIHQLPPYIEPPQLMPPPINPPPPGRINAMPPQFPINPAPVAQNAPPIAQNPVLSPVAPSNPEIMPPLIQTPPNAPETPTTADPVGFYDVAEDRAGTVREAFRLAVLDCHEQRSEPAWVSHALGDWPKALKDNFRDAKDFAPRLDMMKYVLKDDAYFDECMAKIKALPGGEYQFMSHFVMLADAMKEGS